MASGTPDLADAHVVIVARRADQPVVTSDPGDLRRLDPALRADPEGIRNPGDARGAD